MKIIKSTISAVLISVLLAGTISITNGGAADNTNAKEDSYLVLTDDPQALETVRDMTDDYDYVMSQKGSEKTVSAVELTGAEAAELRETEGVLSVEKDITLSGSKTSKHSKQNNNSKQEDIDVSDFLFQEVDSDDINQWYLDAVGTDSVENGEKVKIELLDSGVNLSQDIKVKSRVNLIPDSSFNPMYEDFSGHGTSMASVITSKDNGKNVTGINPNADLYSVRVLDDNIQAPLSRIVEGIRWGIDNDMDIINMSFGTSVNSAVLKAAIEEADRAGILLISATGNQSEKGVQYPAAYPQVLAVGSMDENSSISDFTSVGKEMDVVAPGEKIETNGIFGTIQTADGTSIATAEVSAAASKLLEKDKTKSPDFIKKLIKASAKRITDSGIVTGAVDCDYALDIYDEFEKSYTLNPQTEEYTNTEATEVYDTDGVVEGLWNGDSHASFAASACENRYRNIENFEHALDLIKAGARVADKEEFEGFRFHDVYALHGLGNYVSNLKVIWTFICKLNQNSSFSSAEIAAKNVAINLESYVESANTQELLDKLVRCLKKLKEISFDSLLSSSYNDNMTEKEKVKYKAIGLFLHMVCDIFAHRAQVPTAFSGKDENNEDFFQENKVIKGEKYNIFKSDGSDYTKIEDINNVLKTAQNANYLSNNEKKRTLEYLKKATSLAVVEFRDIKKYSNLYFKNGFPTSIVCLAYEDDSTFYSRRYEESGLACKRFISFGFTNDFNFGCLVPSVNYLGTSIKLSQFKEFVIKTRTAGTDISTSGYKCMTNAAWNRCTSYLKRINATTGEVESIPVP